MPRGIYPRAVGVSYNRRHIRVRQARGVARNHKCVDCGEQAHEWSTRHDTDGMSPHDYDPRCRRCHRAYDWTPEWSESISQGKTGLKRPDVAERNRKNAYARPCSEGCTCGKHRRKSAAA